MYVHLIRVSGHTRQNLMELKGEIIDQLDQLEYLSNGSRIYILFQVYMKFIKMDYILGHRRTLTTFKRIETIQNKFSDYYGIKLEISNRKISGKSPSIWELNNNLNNP